MKKMMITGASGFLGSRIAGYYKESFELLCPTHKELDITEKEQIQHYMEENKPDVLIHCAAISDVVDCEKNLELSYKMNVLSCEYFAKESKKLDIKCILCSSDQVYFGSKIDTPHTEKEELTPFNTYGKQKLEMEQRCLEINLDAVLLRLAWMYDAEKNYESQHGDFISTLKQNLVNQKPLSYPIYDKRSITDIHEVVQNLEKVMLLPGGVYNYGSYNEMSTYDTMRQVFAKCGMTYEIQKNETGFADNHRNLCMNLDKISRYGITFSSTLDGLVRNLLPICS